MRCCVRSSTSHAVQLVSSAQTHLRHLMYRRCMAAVGCIGERRLVISSGLCGTLAPTVLPPSQLDPSTQRPGINAAPKAASSLPRICEPSTLRFWPTSLAWPCLSNSMMAFKLRERLLHLDVSQVVKKRTER